MCYHLTYMGTQLSRFLTVSDRLFLAAHPPSLNERRFRANGPHTLRGADRACRRSLYRGFLAFMVDLFSVTVLQTRRGGSRSPLGCDTKSCK